MKWDNTDLLIWRRESEAEVEFELGDDVSSSRISSMSRSYPSGTKSMIGAGDSRLLPAMTTQASNDNNYTGLSLLECKDCALRSCGASLSCQAPGNLTPCGNTLWVGASRFILHHTNTTTVSRTTR